MSTQKYMTWPPTAQTFEQELLASQKIAFVRNKSNNLELLTFLEGKDLGIESQILFNYSLMINPQTDDKSLSRITLNSRLQKAPFEQFSDEELLEICNHWNTESSLPTAILDKKQHAIIGTLSLHITSTDPLPLSFVSAHLGIEGLCLMLDFQKYVHEALTK